jgi:hypothetical protein
MKNSIQGSYSGAPPRDLPLILPKDAGLNYKVYWTLWDFLKKNSEKKRQKTPPKESELHIFLRVY